MIKKWRSTFSQTLRSYQMKYLKPWLFLSISLMAGLSYGWVLPDPQTRGVWAPAGYSPSDSAGIDSLVRNLWSANFNVIYLGVWNGHSDEAGTIYPSNVMKNAGGPQQFPEYVGRDPLRLYIDIAHKYGMEVIAWFELMPFDVSVAQDSTDLPRLIRANPSWRLMLRDTSMNSHRTIYGYFFGIDPGVPAASDFAVRLYTEIAENYPDLDGVESDIENDTLFSYSAIARSRTGDSSSRPLK